MGTIPAVTQPSSTPSEFKVIAVTKLAAPAASLTFSGIAATYIELICTYYMQMTTVTTQPWMLFNNSTASDYNGDGWGGNNAGAYGPTENITSGHQLTGGNNLGTTYGVSGTAHISKIAAAQYAVMHNIAVMLITGDGGPRDLAMANSWRNSSALINRIDITASSSTLATSSMARLEGLAP